jgi:hypothetical protein
MTQRAPSRSRSTMVCPPTKSAASARSRLNGPGRRAKSAGADNGWSTATDQIPAGASGAGRSRNITRAPSGEKNGPGQQRPVVSWTKATPDGRSTSAAT